MKIKSFVGVIGALLVLALALPLFYQAHLVRIKIVTDKHWSKVALEYKDANDVVHKKQQITGASGKAEFWLKQKEIKGFRLLLAPEMKLEDISIKGKGKVKVEAAKGPNYDKVVLKGRSHFDWQVGFLFVGVFWGAFLLLTMDWQKELSGKMPELKNIEFLRVIYTLGVVCVHFFSRIDLFSNGGQGVAFFFLLSGYFLVLTFNPDKSTADFVKQKFVRFVPMIIFGSIICGGYLTWVEGVFFLQNTGLTFGDMTNAPAWYLGVLFWVLLFYFYLRKTVDGKQNNLIVGVITFLACVVCVQTHGGRLNLVLGYFPRGMLTGLSCVGVGCLLAGVCTRNNNDSKIGWGYSLFELVLLGWCLASLLVPMKFLDSIIWETIAHVGIVWLFVQKRGWLSNLLESKYWVLAARYCLAVYLTHFAITSRFMNLWRNIGDYDWMIDHKPVVIVAILASSCLFGVFAYHAVEKPAAKLLKNRLG